MLWAEPITRPVNVTVSFVVSVMVLTLPRRAVVKQFWANRLRKLPGGGSTRQLTQPVRLWSP